MKPAHLALATSLTLAFGTAAAAQTQPTMPTEPTTQPPTTQPTMPTDPATTTQPTMPTEPATTQPTTTETGQVTPATEADIKAGAEVYDQNGELVGKVDSVKSSGAVVNTGKARAEIPISSFGKNDKGLVISISKADLDAQAKSKPKG